LPARNCASAKRVASSADAPPEIASRYCSARCCEISSTMSASRSGFKLSGASRARTSLCQSCMFSSRDPAHGLDERLPCFDLRGEHSVTLGRDFVEPASPLPGLLDPRSLDPPSLLEPIQQRI